MSKKKAALNSKKGGLNAKKTNRKGNGIKMNILATNASASSLQFSLFEWSAKLFAPKLIKKTVCLDCEKKELTLKFNYDSGIFEGKRVCKLCTQLQKRKYLSW